MTVRKEVKWFANRMEHELSMNDHKPGWKNCGKAYLLGLLLAECSEVVEAVINDDDMEITSECADVANVAMMIADNWGYKE